MAFKRYFKDLDKKFAWSFFGVVLALTFGGITLYKEFLEDKRAALQYEILTNTSVLDVREQLSNLSVLFEGVDIRKQKLTLRVVTVRVVNPSSRDILKGHYDDRAPLGVNVSTGRVIRSEIADTSSTYLRDTLTLKIKNEKTLLFGSVILESEQFFTIKLLLLHPEEIVPTLSQVGKVAGIQVIPIREPYKDAGKEPFSTKTFSGGVFVQIVRLLGYSIGAIGFLFVLFIVSVVPIALIIEKTNKRKNKKTVKEFKGITKVDLNESDEYIFTEYIEGGKTSISLMQALISDEAELSSVYARYIENQKREKQGHVRPPVDWSKQDNIVDMWWVRSNRIENCIKTGIFEKTENGLKVDEHFATTFEHFVRFLKNRGLIPHTNNLLTTNRQLVQANPTKIGDADAKGRAAV